MKKLFFIALMFLILSTSCEREASTNLSIIAVPVTQTISEFRASVEIQQPRAIRESGKIYAWEDYIFINDKNEGVHVIDNSDPYNPTKLNFLKIPKNMDIAIKDEKLYADSGMDLVVFDIKDMNNITEITRIEDVFPTYYAVSPEGANYVDFSNFDVSKQVIVGYILVERKIEFAGPEWERFQTAANTGGNTGTGGSMARFGLLEDYLYAVDQQKLSVFDISQASEPSVLHSEYVGWDIETLFNYEGFLYLGSSTGMYIYTLEDPSRPRPVSFLQHVQGCDPVVVKDNYAYVTIRGGNACGQNFNQLDVVDVSDKSAPHIVNSYEMTNPFGLGVKDEWLFVCDGVAGLKVYDIKDTPNLRLIDQFSNIHTYDVIPLEDRLLMVGDNILNQYSYKGNEINLISSFSLN